MSASYWDSSQRRRWLFTKEELAAMRQTLDEGEDAELVRLFPLPEPRHLAIYFNQQLLRLAKRLSIRQQPLATAQTYLKRFYLTIQIRNTNPYLVLTTALYLACKLEESPQHIRLIVTEARALWQQECGSVLDVSRVGECEFWMISEMRSELIVHHPYRVLLSLREQGGFFGGLAEEDWGMARGVVNDCFMTDLVLLHAPHVIALVGILLALVLRPGPGGGQQQPQQQQGGQQQGGQSAGGPMSTSAAAGLAAAQAAMQAAQASEAGGVGVGVGDVGESASGAAVRKPTEQAHRVTRVQHFVAWLAESEVDVAAMVDVTQEVISYYACYEAEYNEKLTREQVMRFVKARGLDK